MREFRIHRQVAEEFNEVVDWYASHSMRAADHFAERFEAALAKARLHPTTQAPWRISFRRVRLARFPYVVIFHTDSKHTSVLALVHERREHRRTFELLSERKRTMR